nr:hypothetical protein CFP56_38235 [Quercus suber]
MLPIGSREHNHVRCVLTNVAGLGGGPATNGRANNGHETESTATASPSTSTTPVSTLTCGRRAIASPSTSAVRGCGRPATASPSTSTTRGRGQRATTPRVVTSPEIPAPIPHASPHPETLPPMVDASLQPKVPSPTPLSQPNFDLGIDQNLTPPILPKTPLYPPTSSSAPIPSLYTEHHYPPTSSSSDPLGPLVGIDTLQPHTDVLDKHLPHQPSSPQGRPQRIRRAPTCGIGGHKIGHQGKFMVCMMMSLTMMPCSLLPRPNIIRGLKNEKLVNLEKEGDYVGSFRKMSSTAGIGMAKNEEGLELVLVNGGSHARKMVSNSPAIDMLELSPTSVLDISSVKSNHLHQLVSEGNLDGVRYCFGIRLGDGKEYPGGQNDVDAGEEDGLKMSSSSEEDISEKNWKDY